jgi:hypothetical protein
VEIDLKKDEQGQINFGLNLVVVDNGFVYVGNVIYDEGYYIVVNCANVQKAAEEVERHRRELPKLQERLRELAKVEEALRAARSAA